MDKAETLLERVINERDPHAFEQLFCMPNEELDKIIEAWKNNKIVDDIEGEQ
jgi:hypothetical protein